MTLSGGGSDEIRTHGRAGLHLFSAEVLKNEKPEKRIVLKIADEHTFHPDPVVDVVTLFEGTYLRTRPMMVRDPDGRIWKLEALGEKVEFPAPPPAKG